jgi:hypothetical protein
MAAFSGRIQGEIPRFGQRHLGAPRGSQPPPDLRYFSQLQRYFSQLQK